MINQEVDNAKVKILLVDDKMENLISLEHLLFEKDNSLEFIKVTSGQEALKQAFFQELALILLDVQMPDMDGYEVARLLKSNTRTQNIPIIFVTASNQDVESQLIGYETGAVDYLFKPLNPSVTKAKVRSFVRMYRQQLEIERLTQLVNNSLDLMCLIDARTLQIINANPAWETQLGYSPNEIQGEYFYNLVSCKDVSSENEDLKTILMQNTRLTNFEACVISSKREKKFFLWSFVLNNNVWYGNGKEFTERKHAEEQLQVAQDSLVRLNTELEERVKNRTDELKRKNDELRRINADLDNFIYTASHDLKAPISNIEGLVGALNDTCNDGDDSRKLITMINTSVDRFKKVISELTDLAKVHSEDRLDIELVEFSKLIDEIKQDVKDLILQNQAIIVEDYTAAPAIRFSRKNLRSVLYNVVSNAIKYRSPERTPEVRITTSRANQCILISIRDNGLGIREEDKVKVFSMFKRLHVHVEGTGIGMSLVKRIVDNSGGKIEVESKVGEGTTFNIYLKEVK